MMKPLNINVAKHFEKAGPLITVPEHVIHEQVTHQVINPLLNPGPPSARERRYERLDWQVPVITSLFLVAIWFVDKFYTDIVNNHLLFAISVVTLFIGWYMKFLFKKAKEKRISKVLSQ
jgi:hypothetical protein